MNQTMFALHEEMNLNGYVERINHKDAKYMILNHHYAKRLPSITYAFGLFKNNELVGVCSFGLPPSNSLCVGICGENFSRNVIELNRLVLLYNEKNQASFFIAQCLKLLPKPKIVVSYADTSQNHLGIVYQATNFLYTGLSDARTEWRMKESNLHSKTLCEQYSLEERKNNDNFYVTERPRKHRYIIFLGSKKDKKIFRKNLNYPIRDYPTK